MTVVFPAGVTAEGNVKAQVVPAIAVKTGPTVAEITAGIDISGFVMAGQFTPGTEQGRGTNRRLGSKQTFQRLGRDNPSFENIQYVYYPQSTTPDPNNKAFETLVSGYAGFVVVRFGLDAQATAWAAAQKVEVWPVEFGVQQKLPPPEDDEFALLTVSQAVAVTGVVERNATVAV